MRFLPYILVVSICSFSMACKSKVNAAELDDQATPMDIQSGIAADESTTLQPDNGDVQNAHDTQRPHVYSPFAIVNKSEDSVFKTITFTDVGQKELADAEDNTLLLEVIAESLSYHLVEDNRLNYTPEVIYDKSLMDPAEHQFCARHHLYVALWRSESPERWGYSLWSGCSEEHEFAWQEVPIINSDTNDLVASVEPLTDSIVESIAKATHNKCFLKHC